MSGGDARWRYVITLHLWRSTSVRVQSDRPSLWANTGEEFTMCHPIIMEYVKGKALSRRDLFRGSAAAGAAIVASAALTPRPVLAQPASRVVDLTPTLT